MLQLARDLICEALGEDLVAVRLEFQGERESGIASIGCRYWGVEEIAQNVAIMPSRSLVIRLPRRLFEDRQVIELAVKEHGFAGEAPPRWDQVDWSWSGLFQADIEEGKPVLRTVEAEAQPLSYEIVNGSE